MKATFKPTGFVFTFEDKYFVQAQHDEKQADGFDVCRTLGCFETYSDALDFARTVAKRFHVKAVHIFTREAQIETIHLKAVV